MEHLTQIRTDECSMRDFKVHQLEEEVKRSKEINSRLMIDNFIMKTRLDAVSCSKSNNKRNKELKTFITSSNTTIDEKNNLFETGEQENAVCKIDGDKSLKRTTSIGDRLNQYLSRKNALSSNSVQNIDKNKNKENSCIDNKNQNKAQKQSSTNSTTLTTLERENEFCWRCLRNGHSGSKCNESETILGRYICGLCNKAGHNDENCGKSNININ